MDPVRNPFVPGAGAVPPELAGRDSILFAADVALRRTLKGRHSQSQIMLGLRGTGKTVLLNRIAEMAEDLNLRVSFIEAPENKALANLIVPKALQVLRKLSLVAEAKALSHQGLRALAGFIKAFKVSAGEVSLSIEPEVGVADSGELEFDLAELFERVGKAAAAADTAWVLLVDEVQYLRQRDLAALIVAIHRMNQRSLPVMFFGAGLPQIAGLSGDAKSYAERLFAFPKVGPLDEVSARDAIEQPIKDEGEAIDDAAIAAIVEQTRGYPYFLQEWGFQTWNAAEGSPIEREDVEDAATAAIRRLDEGFFQVRFERLTPKEREYVFAMSSLGDGPYRSADVASAMGETTQKLAVHRARIIGKGMIYMPAHGDLDFTVPMFADYLRRMNDGA